jgi:hypothetical protein
VRSLKARARSIDWLGILLVGALFRISSAGLARARWADHLEIVPTVALLGVAVGAALATSRFGPRMAAIFAVLYGALAVTWMAAGTLDPALPWSERISALNDRALFYLGVLLRGENNQDPLMFVMLIAGLYWLFAAYGAWAVFRRRGLWSAVVPAGLALLISVNYYVGRAPMGGYVGGYVLLAILFVLRRHLVARREAWDAMRTQSPPHGAAAIAQAGALAALVIVALAWGGPAFARSDAVADLWADISRPWPHLREQIGDAFGRLRSPAVVVEDAFGESLQLGAGAEPEDTLVMFVKPDRSLSPGSRFYWRARIYDTYIARQWSASPGEPFEFDPTSGDLLARRYQGRLTVDVEITSQLPAFRMLYLPSQPLWVSRDSTAAVTIADEESVDVSSVTSHAPVMPGESYRVRSSVAAVTAERLRAAGTDYPGWVRPRYLQLPVTITERTRALAEEITAGFETPYDKVAAITRWLRNHILYSRTTFPPPEGVEPIDWFLFDYRVGFCNYYASAEVVLLRSLGIPARLAVGYASGTYDEETGVYVVRAADAHAWPEVFFPGYGWVEFEPTTSLPDLERPDTSATAVEIDRLLGADPGFGEEPTGRPGHDPSLEMGSIEEQASPWAALASRPLLLLGLLAASVAGLALGLWLWLDPYAKARALGTVSQRMRRIGVGPRSAALEPPPAPATPSGETYFRWTLWLGRIGLPLSPAQTPFERAEAFASRLPEAREAAWSLVSAYVRERFGGRPGDAAVVRAAWRSLRPQLWRAWAGRAIASRGAGKGPAGRGAKSGRGRLRGGSL